METSLATRKLQAIELITKLENEDLLTFIEQLLIGEKAEPETDWANSLSNKEKASIQRGLDDLDKGRSVNYEVFKEKMKTRLP